MKNVIFLLGLVLIMSSTARSQWFSVGNAERMSTDFPVAGQFVITDDSKFAYAIYGDTIKKIDLIQGKVIGQIVAKFDSTLIRPIPSLFLSLDAKTYIVPQYNKGYHCYINYNRVYDIENQNLLDSINNYLDATDKDFKYNDKSYYNYHDNKLISLINFQYQQSSGLFKIDYDNLLVSFSRNFNLLYIRQNIHEFSYIYHGEITSDIITGKLTASNGTITQLESFQSSAKRVDNDYTYSESGTNLNIQNAIFTNNGTKLIYYGYFKYYIRSTENPQDVKSYLLDINLFQKGLNALIEPEDKLLFAFTGDSINQFFVYNGRFLQRTRIDSVSNINQAVCSPDSQYVYLSNKKNELYRVKLLNLIPLRAVFELNKKDFFVGDTVITFNYSLGRPDSCRWRFGDGSESTEFSPIKIYSKINDYTVKLIVYKNGNADSAMTSISVLPNLKADFDYTLSGNDVITCNFVNKSSGKIDSVKWDFGNTYTSTLNDPATTYVVSGTFTVLLKAYSGIYSDTVSKIVPITASRAPIDNSKLIEEYFFDNSISEAAYTAYEDNGKIIYLTKGEISSREGVFDKTQQKLWENNFLSTNRFMAKKDNNSYVIASNGSIFDYDINGNVSNSFTAPIKDIISLKCINKTPSISAKFDAWSSLGGFYFFNSLNKLQDRKIPYFTPYGLLEGQWNGKSNDLICYGDTINNIFIASCEYYGNPYSDKKPFDLQLVQKHGANSIKAFYNETYEIKIIDMIPLNDSILVYCGKDYFLVFNFYSRQYSSKFLNCQINSLIKLSDSTFGIVGSYHNLPSVFIANSSCQVLDSIIITNRQGSFNFASLCYDGTILGSGLNYITKETYVPYFGKLKSSYFILSVDENKTPASSNIREDLALFPNPATDFIEIEGIEQISIKPEAILIYNIFGEMLNLTPTLSKGEAIRLDVSLLPTGLYFVRAGDKVSKFVKM